MKKRLTLLLLVVMCCSVGGLAQTSKRRAVRAGLPASTDLIDTALRSGRISEETALKYRVFAAFGDCRLPSQFRGNDTDVTETSALDEIAAKWSTLSSDTQVILAPYLREPYAADGWLAAQQAACGGVTPSAISAKTITILGGKVRVIYDSFMPGEESVARDVAAALQSPIYPKLTTLMGEPLPYDSSGKDPTRLSVSILNSVNFKGEASFLDLPPSEQCNHGPAFIEINARATKLPSVVAHEVMHALIAAYPLATNCEFPEYRWINEASATWAEDYVYPNPPEGDEEHRFAPAFLNRPEVSLEHDDGESDHHEYGAYLLPFYIHRRYNDADFVHRIWAAAGSKLSLDAVDDALGPHGGFKEQWPEFVLRNWNRPPYDDYTIEDRLTNSAKEGLESLYAPPEGTFNISTFATPGALAIQPLSAQYFHFDIDSSVRTVAFVNGLNFKLGIREWSIAPDFGKTLILDNASQPRDGLKIQALLKINGTWEKDARDWTQRPFIGFCREFAAEHVDEIVLMVSNSEYRKRDAVQPEGMLPLMWASNMSCAAWKTEKATYTMISPPVTVTWDATFKRANDYTNVDPLPTLPAEGLPFLYYLYSASGTVSWGFQSSTGNCTYSGSGSAPLDGVLATWNFSPPEAKMHRAYIGVMKTDSSQRIHYTETCGSSSSTFDISVPGWAITPIDNIIRRVSSDGTTIHDSNNENLVGTSEWIMKAIPP